MKLKTFVNLLGAVLIALMAFNTHINCNKAADDKKLSDTVKVIHDTIPGDSFPYIVYRDVPEPYAVLFNDTVQIYPDTAAILADYFAQYLYSDTLRNDSSYVIIIQDTISRNRIAGRTVSFQNLRPLAITHTYITTQQQPQRAFYAGAQAGATLSGKFTFAPSLAIADKRGRLLSIHYDIVNKEVRAGYLIKLHK